MKSGLFGLVSVFALACQAADGKAGSPRAVTVQESWSLPGILGTGVKANDAYVDGSFFLTVPAYSSIGRDGWLDGDVIFLEPYTSWGEQGEVAVSLGLGWRHLFSQQGVGAILKHDGHQAGFWEEGGFIGANVFLDMLDTQFDNRFWQFGFGVEAGTRYLEARANYYLPLSDRQLAEEIRTQESVTTRALVPTYDEPFATGHTIQQDVTWSTLESTTTIERLFRRYEDGMEGWDAELALLLPWIDRWMDVKVIGGFYSFDNQPFGPQTGGTGKVEGWKAGLEVRPVPAVVLNATWYEDDRLTGADWTAGVRLEIPFEAGDLGDGKGFWGRIGDAFRPRRRHLAERMVEPVRRQNAAIKTSTSVEEDEDAAEVRVETRVVSQSRRRVVLADSVVFVDNAIGDPANPGTYEAPLDTIQGGENIGNSKFGSGSIVMVQGRAQAYTENVTISQGVRLFGSGSFPGLGGRVFHGRTNLMPLLNGGFVAQNIPSTVAISGFEITGGLVSTGFGAFTGLGQPMANMGILFDNVAQGVIIGNKIHGIVDGVYVESSGAGNVSRVLVRDNVFSGNGAGNTLVSDLLGHLDARVENNLFTGNTTVGIFAATGGRPGAGGTGTFAISGNTITGNLQGIQVGSFTGNGATFSIVSNVIAGNVVGLMAAGNLGGTADVFVSDNQIIFNSLQGIYGQEVGGTLNFNSTGALNNTVLKMPGSAATLYEPTSGNEGGFIFINGSLHPANITLP